MKKVVSILLACVVALSIGSFSLAKDLKIAEVLDEISPAEYVKMSLEERKAYKDIVIYPMYSEASYNMDQGPWDSLLERLWNSGQIYRELTYIVRHAAFSLLHPRIKLVVSTFNPWTPRCQDVLMSLYASGDIENSPAIYWWERDAIDKGLCADLTPFYKDYMSDLKLDVPLDVYNSLTANFWKDGKLWFIPIPAQNAWRANGTFWYRTDWFEEAGIFDEYGKPGPSSDWTYEDFREIAKKLTDTKKGRWGYVKGAINLTSQGDLAYVRSYGHLRFRPRKDGTGWEFNSEDPVVANEVKLLNEMMFKDKSMLGGVDYGFGECGAEMINGRVGMGELRLMSMLPNWTSNAYGDIPWSVALNPAAPYGMRANTMRMVGLSINPLYDQKQIAASLEVFKHTYVGRGQNITVYGASIYRNMGIPYGYLMPDTPVFQLEYPSTFEPPLTERYPKKIVDLIDRTKNTPRAPDPLAYGLEIPLNQFDWGDELRDVTFRRLWSLALTTPDLDVEKALKDTAKIVNPILADLNIKDARTKFKNYFTALGEFYKKNYPEFYEKEWPTLLENQYKVW